MANGVGYLYRVGVSRTRPRKAVEPERVAAGGVGSQAVAEQLPVDPDLSSALAALSEQQRVTVVLVHGFGWSMKDTAELLEVSVPTVGTHLRRGLAALRHRLATDRSEAAGPASLAATDLERTDD